MSTLEINIRHRTSDFRHPTINIRRLTSDIWHQTTDIRSDIRQQISDIWWTSEKRRLIWEVWQETSVIWHQTVSIRGLRDIGRLTSNNRRPTSDSKHQTSDMKRLTSKKRLILDVSHRTRHQTSDNRPLTCTSICASNRRYRYMTHSRLVVGLLQLCQFHYLANLVVHLFTYILLKVRSWAEYCS